MYSWGIQKEAMRDSFSYSDIFLDWFEAFLVPDQ
jgi:hypothetical protein